MNSSVILLVDDTAEVRSVVATILRREGYVVETATDGAEALAWFSSHGAPDCCLLDIVMPRTGGFEVLRTLRSDFPETPVVMLTGMGTADNAVSALRQGACDFLTKPIDDPDALLRAVKRALRRRKSALEARWSHNQLEQEVREKTRELAIRNRQLAGYAEELEGMTVNIVASLQAAMEAKDLYTAGHSTRVTHYCSQIGRQLSLSDEEMLVVERAAMLHDIGKLVVEGSSINKPGPLSDMEWEKMLLHPEVGEKMLRPFPFLQRERAHIRHHHERFDGKGYPDGLSSGQIPLITEILSVADCYDAITSKRSYRRAVDWSLACRELERSIGSQFSPRVVPVFVGLLEDTQGGTREPAQSLHERLLAGTIDDLTGHLSDILSG